MLDDGLHLNGVWVAEVDCAITIQANDLRKPETIQVSRTNAFTLPDSLHLRNILQGAEQIDAGGPYPYASIPAKLVSDGEVIFEGSAKLISFSAGWKVTLFGPLKDLIESLNSQKLRELDLTRYDHLWTNATMTSLAGAATGVTYPAIDYGNYEAGVFGGDSLFPAIYAHTLIGELLRTFGYRPAGAWIADPLYLRLAVPFTEDAPTNKDGDFVADRTARVTVANILPLLGKVNLVIPFTVDNQDSNAFSDGKSDNFKPSLNAYVVDTTMRLRVQCDQQIKASVDFGGMEVKLIAEKNGTNVGQGYFSATGPYNITGTKIDTISLDGLIDCKKGDVIKIRLVAEKRTVIAQWSFFAQITPGQTVASFVPDTTVRPGDTWPVARNLPDLTGADMLKSIALMMSATLVIDDILKTVELVTLDSIKADAINAQNLSANVEESAEPEITVGIDPYGKRNLLNWKELETVTPYGNGVIESPALTTPAESELFQLPFSAVTDSPRDLPGYGPPLLIKTRTFSGIGTNRTINVSATTPRLILIEPGKTILTKVKYVTPEGAIRLTEATLTGCWWGIRNANVKTENNKFSLSFSRLSPIHSEKTLIERYFNALTAILNRPRSLTVSMIFRPEEIAKIDISQPVRLSHVRSGALYLSDNLYYLNTINNYRYGPPCSVTLIPFD